MEKCLAQWIIETRKVGVPVETCMVANEGKYIIHKLYPLSFPAPSEFSEYPFKFSNNCQKRLFKGHKFSLRKTSKSKNFTTYKKEWTHKSKMFHLETKTSQISKINDPVWGVAPPVCVFNKDQVPIDISSAYATTVDNTGEEYDYDAVGNENDFCKLYTLDLVIPMDVEEDLSNLPNPGVVFIATNFMIEDDRHDQEDADLWYDCVLVSFQENAWVEITTYQHHIKEKMKPMDSWCKKKGCRGVNFQENLISYSTYSYNETFNDILPKFHSPRYYASQMSFFLQAVDRHIGKV